MRRWLTSLSSALVAAALPAMTLGAMVWTISVSPLTATEGQVTAFNVTATNVAGGQIGCLEIDLPGSFVILAVSTPVSSSGGRWVGSVTGNVVLTHGLKDPDRVESGESVSFTITAVPSAPGAFLLPNHAHTSVNCTGSDLAGISPLVTVLPAPTPKPTPTPPATPTPRMSASDAPTPTQSATGSSSPDPSRQPTPVESGGTPLPGEPSLTSVGSALATATPSARPTPGSSHAPTAVSVAPFDDSANGGSGDLGMGLDLLGMINGPFTWFVPGAAVGVPGLLVILFAALQALGVLAWIPAVRRMGDDDDRRRGRRRRRPA